MLAIGERDVEVAPIRGDHEPGQLGLGVAVPAGRARRRQAKRRSALAAQMTSFSVTPPASWVANVTTHRE